MSAQGGLCASVVITTERARVGQVLAVFPLLALAGLVQARRGIAAVRNSLTSFTLGPRLHLCLRVVASVSSAKHAAGSHTDWGA